MASVPSPNAAPFVTTIDLEDWFHADVMRAVINPADWDDLSIRADTVTRRLMAILDRHGIKATFFVLGWFAERRPHLVREITQAGHEIACHGYNHEHLGRLHKAAIHADIDGAKKLLEDITGQAVLGYRAPNFSIDERAMDVLASLGFIYDSSLFPFDLHNRYGDLDRNALTSVAAGLSQHRNGLYEIGLPMLPAGPMRLPWAGGGYFRLVSGRLYRAGVRRVRRTGQPFVFYCHPWEFDPGQPVQHRLPGHKRWRHYVGIRSSEARFRRLIAAFGSQVRMVDLLAATRTEQPVGG